MALKYAKHWRLAFSSLNEFGQPFSTHMYRTIGFFTSTNCLGTDLCRAVPVNKILVSASMAGFPKQFANDGSISSSWRTRANPQIACYWGVSLNSNVAIRSILLHGIKGGIGAQVFLQCSNTGGPNISEWEQVGVIRPVNVNDAACYDNAQ